MDSKPEDPKEYLKKFNFIELLNPGEWGKRVPARCKLCKTKSAPQGKVFELHLMKLYAVKHFLGQHLEGSTHQRNQAKHDEKVMEKGAGQVTPCQGINFSDKSSAGAEVKSPKNNPT